jgi:hypothetical protein
VNLSIYCISYEWKYRSGCISTLIIPINYDTRRKWVVSVMPHLLDFWQMCCQYPLNTKLSVLHSLSRCFGENEDPLNLLETDHNFSVVQSVVQSLCKVHNWGWSGIIIAWAIWSQSVEEYPSIRHVDNCVLWCLYTSSTYIVIIHWYTIYVFLCVCVCVCVYIYIYIYIYVCVCVRARACTCIWSCACVWVSVCISMCVCLYVWMFGCTLHMHGCSVCMYVACMCVSLYIYIYIMFVCVCTYVWMYICVCFVCLYICIQWTVCWKGNIPNTFPLSIIRIKPRG